MLEHLNCFAEKKEKREVLTGEEKASLPTERMWQSACSDDQRPC
jgi:formylglycine-generating enzyme required for sulfatase activity